MPAHPDPSLLEALDTYVTALRAGDSPDRQALLKAHPEAAPLLPCLDDLNDIAQTLQSSVDRLQDGPGQSLATTAPAEDKMLALPPSRFGNYELLDVLGRGGMGVVYKARQVDLDRVVALKMILGSQLASAEFISRFRAEARAAAAVRHPHILQIYEAGEVDGQRYFAMECIEGPSLAQVLRQGPMPTDAAARCLAAVARAVGFLHARGMLHRDLKPGNILLDQERRPYLTDFGLVKMLDVSSDLTSTGAIVGTPSYMAPEQAAGKNAEVTARSDIYSLGAILYELLTGRPPFREATPLETLVQVLEGEPTPPRLLNSHVPLELEFICHKALAKSPEDRYPSADALAEDLERFLREEPVLARPESLRQRSLRWMRQEPALASRLAILIVCAAIAQVYYNFRHPVSLSQHLAIMFTLALWAAASIFCQALIRRGIRPSRVRRLWLGTDTVMLTAALILDGTFNSPLILSYGVLIVASGLWFEVGLVWFTTAAATGGYLVLIAVAAWRAQLGDSPQHHGIALAALVLVGIMVVSQVKRVRALSRYYAHRPLS
jgi:serine/threonine-protein kinase